MRIAEAIGSVLFLSASRTRFRSKCHNDVSSCDGSDLDFTQDSARDQSSRINRRVLLVSQALTPRQASSTKLPSLRNFHQAELWATATVLDHAVKAEELSIVALQQCIYSFHSIHLDVLEMLLFISLHYIETISARWRS